MGKLETKSEKLSKGVMLLVVGLSLAMMGILATRELHTVWNVWPTADGVVVRSTVEEMLDVPYTKGAMPIETYSPRIELRYRANNHVYTAEAPPPFTAETPEKAAAMLAQSYAKGSHHPIRYNPGMPSEIRFGAIDFGPLAFSFLLLVGGVIFATAGLRRLVAVAWPQPEIGAAEKIATVAAGGDVLRTTAATVYCASCGQPVKANEDSCPNCLKTLRAA